MAKTVRESSLASEVFVELPIVGSTTRTNRSVQEFEMCFIVFSPFVSFCPCATLVEIYICSSILHLCKLYSLSTSYTFYWKIYVNTIIIWKRILANEVKEKKRLIMNLIFKKKNLYSITNTFDYNNHLIDNSSSKMELKIE